MLSFCNDSRSSTAATSREFDVGSACKWGSSLSPFRLRPLALQSKNILLSACAISWLFPMATFILFSPWRPQTCGCCCAWRRQFCKNTAPPFQADYRIVILYDIHFFSTLCSPNNTLEASCLNSTRWTAQNSSRRSHKRRRSDFIS